MNQKIHLKRTRFLSTEALRGPLEPGSMPVLLGTVHQVLHSSNQDEPNGFCSTCMKNYKFDTPKSLTEMERPESLVGRFPTQAENCCHQPCQVPVGLTVTKAEVTAAVSGRFAPEASCNICCEEA